jgi:hypothetical protein
VFHQGQVKITVEPNEIIIGKRPLKVHSGVALDFEATQGVLRLESFPSSVSLSRDRRTATLMPDDGLAAGPQTLIVGELISAHGKRLATPSVIPFFVSDSRAKVPSRFRVESITRLKVERLATVRISAANRPAGAYVEVMKAVDRRTGKPVELAFDHQGKKVNARRIFETIAKNRRRLYGKLHPTLKALAVKASASRRISVALWLRVPDEKLSPKKERGFTSKPTREESAHAARIAAACERGIELMRRHGAGNPHADPHVPVIYAELPAAAIRRLQVHDDVAAIFFHDCEGLLDLSDSMKIAQSDTVQSTLSLNGKGVNVAVYEDGPDVTTNLSITASFLSNPATSQHSRHTHGIVKNVEARKPHGHASGCNLHSANSMDLAAVSWAAKTRGCTVISQSFHRDAEQTDSGLSFDDMFKDWIVLHWPYPTILQAAGNGSSTEFVNHKGFNSLTVANHNDAASALAGDSVFRNPASAHGDRDLPEVSANGTAVTCVGLTLSGTSMAAPAAAGCTALLQQADSTLKSWPEGCRAILLASASKNITGSTWWSDRTAGVDASDGSGALDALEGVRIVKNRRSRGASGTQRGWDVGTLRSSDFGTNGAITNAYQVTVPRFFFNPRVKVALAWDSLATVLDLLFFQIASDTLQIDLDLKIYDSRGSLVGYSGSWDNSYEIAEFSARSGETYTIKIRRWSGTADVWFGIAWTVQGTPFVRPDWGLTEKILVTANR